MLVLFVVDFVVEIGIIHVVLVYNIVVIFAYVVVDVIVVVDVPEIEGLKKCDY